MVKVLFGFHVVLGMTSENKCYVDFDEMAQIYKALGSGIVGDEKIVRENIKNIFHLYTSFTQYMLWMVCKQVKARGHGKRSMDFYYLVAWYNLINEVFPGSDSQTHVMQIRRMLETTKNLEELSRLVECEKLLFKSTPPAISLQELYQKCLEE